LINFGQIECLRGATKGRQWAKVLFNQVESRINLDPVDALHLMRMKRQAALIKVEQNIACLKKMLVTGRKSHARMRQRNCGIPRSERSSVMKYSKYLAGEMT